MTESQFYYGTALMAREQRWNGVDASLPALLAATGNAFTMGAKNTDTDEFTDECLRIAAFAMRLATKDIPPDLTTGKTAGRPSTAELHETRQES